MPPLGKIPAGAHENGIFKAHRLPYKINRYFIDRGYIRGRIS